MSPKASLMVFEDRLTRLMNIDSSVGDDDRLFMESLNFWKASHRFCWRWNFLVTFSFAVYFFASSFSLLFPDNSMHCATLAAARFIFELESWFLTEVSSFNNITLFWFSIVVHYLFMSWIGITVLFITLLYAADSRIMLLDDFFIPFDQRTTIGSSVLITCNWIGATVWHGILFIYPALDPEDTWMEAAHSWIFVVK